MHTYMPEIEYNAESLSLLSGIEISMERLWERLIECYVENPKAIKEIVIICLCRKLLWKRRRTIKNVNRPPEITRSNNKRERSEIWKRNNPS